MKDAKNTRIFAVTGNPIMHSRSPEMHNAAFAALGIDAVYTRLTAENADEALQLMNEIGIDGINVTTPFKEEILRIVEPDETAKRIGAVNTVMRLGGRFKGSNTDVDGVKGALIGHNIAGKRVIVLGAGGAAKAAIAALLSLGAEVMVLNRTEEKANAIAKKFRCESGKLDEKEAFDNAALIVSTLSTVERVIQREFLKDKIVLDAVYGHETALSLDAKKAGCRVISGKKWLLYSGAKSFEIFSGKKAPIEAMQKALETGHEKTGHEKTNIAIIGMMGSGKGAVSDELEKLTQMQKIDIDSEIEKKRKMKINSIFEDLGEPAFRKMEHEEIKNLQNTKNKIISCGGGVVLDKENIDMLRKNSTIVWLWAAPAELAARLKNYRDRPLLKDKDADKEKELKKILEKRLGLYAACDFVINTGKRTPKEVAKIIFMEMRI